MQLQRRLRKPSATSSPRLPRPPRGRLALLAAPAVLLLLSGALPGAAAQREVLSGTYRWDQGATRPSVLRAEFERQPQLSEGGEPQWKVAFRFRFSGRNRTFRGTAVGDLSQGPVRGVVTEGRRTWVFETMVKKGALQGTHAERKRNGRLYPSGTLTLRLP